MKKVLLPLAQRALSTSLTVMGLALMVLPANAAQTGSGVASLADTERSFAPGTIFDFDGLRVWQTVYAGRSSLAGDAREGTQDVTASILGTTFGADKQIDDLTLLGASLGSSHQTFSSDSGNGGSEDVAATLYGRRTVFDQAYISLALGYGWHDVSTHRPVPLLSILSFDANYHAHDFGGRLEGGYNFTLDKMSSIVPFLAVVGDAYHQPSYSETAPNLLSDFAASYLPSTIGVTHTELGTRYFQTFTIGTAEMSLDTNLAWERELDDNPLVLASFETVPGSYYVLHGTRPAPDTALLGLGFRAVDGGFTFGIRSDGRLGNGTTILSGTTDITYQW